jgi:hypothetical protein
MSILDLFNRMCTLKALLRTSSLCFCVDQRLVFKLQAISSYERHFKMKYRIADGVASGILIVDGDDATDTGGVGIGTSGIG